jgi:outer membrane protein OmpA-like peptidoglycan-associated protein
MMMQQSVWMSLAVAGMMITSVGCATKKHVKASIAPLEGRMGVVEKRAGQAESDIDALEKQLSQTSEIASGAEREAKAAKAAAIAADGKAVAADQKAQGAQTLAEKGLTRIGEVEANLTQAVERVSANIDNYQMVKTESIVFGFNKADLSKEQTEKLDAFAASFKNNKKFVVEVQGFTDKMGDAKYNQDLSQKRAMAVVRYLTVTHNVPLRRIQMLGVGAENPVGDNKTKEGREQNRRVEIKVFALPDDGKPQAAIAKSL